MQTDKGNEDANNRIKDAVEVQEHTTKSHPMGGIFSTSGQRPRGGQTPVQCGEDQTSWLQSRTIGTVQNYTAKTSSLFLAHGNTS